MKVRITLTGDLDLTGNTLQEVQADFYNRYGGVEGYVALEYHDGTVDLRFEEIQD